MGVGWKGLKQGTTAIPVALGLRVLGYCHQNVRGGRGHGQSGHCGFICLAYATFCSAGWFAALAKLTCLPCW